MSLLGSIIFVINGCSQDMAAALLAVGFATVRMLSASCPSSGYAANRGEFLLVHNAVVRITSYSFCLIIFSVTVMAVYIERGGGPLRLGYLQTVEITFKYGLILSLGAVWLVAWLRLSKQVGYIKTKHDL